MDFDMLFSSAAAAVLVVVRRVILLILYPYRTMRTISIKSNKHQVLVIFGIALLYFLIAHRYRFSLLHGLLAFGLFLGIFYLTVCFFYLFSSRMNAGINFSSFVYTFSYTLIPTLFWFWATFLLFIILPPPRNFTFLGTGFSIFFVAYSLSLLAWKLILVYLAVRFSSRQGIYRIIYMLILYLIIFLPASVFFYYQKIFRIPFI